MVSPRAGLQDCQAFFDVVEKLNSHLMTANQIRQTGGDNDRPVTSVRTVVADI